MHKIYGGYGGPLIRERDKERGIGNPEDGTWEQISPGSEGASLATPANHPTRTRGIEPSGTHGAYISGVISGRRKRRALRTAGVFRSQVPNPADPFAALPAVSSFPAFLRYFVAPAVNPPRQYFPSRINAVISGKTLISDPSAIR